MKKINVCIRGGAAPGFNAYAPIDFELETKPDARFGRLGGVSVGNLKSAMFACGVWGEEARRIVKSIKYDRIMQNIAMLQDPDRSWLAKMFLAPVAYAGSKYRLSPEFQRVLGKYLSWEKAKAAGIADEVYLGFADRREFAVVEGLSNVTSFLDMYKIMAKGQPSVWRGWQKHIRPYWAARDGVYSWTVKHGLHKISDTVIPMHLAVYGGFANPIVKDLKLKIKLAHKQERDILFFDGGVINNHSNLIFSGFRGAWTQIGCEPEPKKAKTYSDFHYLQCPSKNYVHMKPTTDNIDFFGFTDRQVDEAYNRCRPATNLWG